MLALFWTRIVPVVDAGAEEVPTLLMVRPIEKLPPARHGERHLPKGVKRLRNRGPT